MSESDKNPAAAPERRRPPADEKPVKSYWYPDRVGQQDEVLAGYKNWRADHALFQVALFPALLGFVIWYAMSEPQVVKLVQQIQKDLALLQAQSETDVYFSASVFGIGLLLLAVLPTAWFLTRKRTVYLVDFATYTPPAKNKVPNSVFMAKSRESGYFTEEILSFQEKLLPRTGLGEETYFPDGIHASPPDTSVKAARDECEQVLFGVMDDLFRKTGLSPKDIDILVVNCSLFNPTPSIATMVIHHYKLRSDIRSYNLAGMGCSAGVISVDLAKDLLQVHANSIAVVLSTENITQNWYRGNDKAMLVANTLFRMGGAGVVLSNRPRDRSFSKYRLVATVRTHKGQSEEGYQAVFQTEDPAGIVGVRLSKTLMSVVSGALKANITTLGPICLPWMEQLKYFANLVARRFAAKGSIKPYTPDFKKAFQHFCIHAGGRAIIDGMEENLALNETQTEPSRATLYRYGNTSSSSIWYELMFIERSGRMKKGDRIWQIAVGSGVKCNSAVWESLRTIKGIKKPDTDSQ